MIAAAIVVARAGLAAWGAYTGTLPLAGNLMDAVAPAAVALLMGSVWWRLRARTPRFAIAWALFGWAYLCYAAAEVLGIMVGERIDASAASVAGFALYLAFFPLFLAGAMRLPSAPLGRHDRIALLLDMGIVVLGAGLVIWTLVVRPALATGEPQTLRVVMTVAYPVGDLVVLWALLRLVLLPNGRSPAAGYRMLAASAACMIATDLGYGYYQLHRGLVLWHVLDPGWMASHSLAGLAAVAQLLATGEPVPGLAAAGETWKQSRSSLHLAYTWLVGALLVLLGAHLGAVGIVGAVAVMAMVALVVARQVSWMSENDRLAEALRVAHDTLEQHVGERTAELARANAVLTTEVEERTRAEERIELQFERLAALRRIDSAITGSLDLRVIIDVLLDNAVAQLRVDAATVLLLDPVAQTLEAYGRRGFRAAPGEAERVAVGEGHAGKAALYRRLVTVADLVAAPDTTPETQLSAAEGFFACWAVPLVAKGQVKGVLEVFTRGPLDADPEWLDFLSTLAGQGAIAIDNSALFERTQRSNLELALAYDSTLEGWSRALELRDRETQGHTQRVTDLTVRLARALGVGEAELVHVRRGALLHDIGKMAIPDTILLKPGPLDDDEWRIMRKHPVYAFEMLSRIAYLRPALDIPYCHHEHFDGSGYPRGLKGAEIPLAARIFAVVDNWDALSFDRPYRQAWRPDRVRQHIVDKSGSLFDPAVAESFLAMMP